MIKANTPTYLRSDETWAKYKKEPKRTSDHCFMCAQDYKVVKEYEHWTIVENNYPYDAVAETHHMLIPNSHVADPDLLTMLEGAEYHLILDELNKSDLYDCHMRNFTIGQSHPTHLHYHLLTWKRR